MSSPRASRAAASPDPTLADALAIVAAADLPNRRRQDIASALRMIARVIDRPAERIPAHPRLLADRLKQVTPLAIGIFKGALE